MSMVLNNQMSSAHVKMCHIKPSIYYTWRNGEEWFPFLDNTLPAEGPTVTHTDVRLYFYKAAARL